MSSRTKFERAAAVLAVLASIATIVELVIHLNTSAAPGGSGALSAPTTVPPNPNPTPSAPPITTPSPITTTSSPTSVVSPSPVETTNPPPPPSPILQVIPLTSADVTEYSGYSAMASRVEINGTTFESAAVVKFVCGPDTEYVIFDIHRTAKRFRATAGVQDRSPEQSDMTFSVYGDGGSRLWGPTEGKSGQSFPIDIPVTGVLHLKLQASGAGACLGDSQYGAFGDPRITAYVIP